MDVRENRLQHTGLPPSLSNLEKEKVSVVYYLCLGATQQKYLPRHAFNLHLNEQPQNLIFCSVSIGG